VSSVYIIYADPADRSIVREGTTWASGEPSGTVTYSSEDVSTDTVRSAIQITPLRRVMALFPFDTSALSGTPTYAALMFYSGGSTVTKFVKASYTGVEANDYRAYLGPHLTATGGTLSAAPGVPIALDPTAIDASATFAIGLHRPLSGANVAPTFDTIVTHGSADVSGTASDPRLTVVVGDQVVYVRANSPFPYNSTATNATPTLPTGYAANDIFLCLVETANQPVTASAGWEEVTGSPQGTGTAGGTVATGLQVFWKRAAASTGETSPTITGTGDHKIIQILLFRGAVQTGDPWDVTAGDVLATASTAFTIPGLTTTVAGCLIVDIVANGTDTATTQTTFANNTSVVGHEEISDYNNSTNNGGGFGVAIGYKETAGAVSATTGTLTTSSVQARLKIALKPEPTGAEPPPTGGMLKVWDGTGWVEKPVKVWDGSAWVEKPVKRWDGTEWVLT
jgi:hypothetical protein